MFLTHYHRPAKRENCLSRCSFAVQNIKFVRHTLLTLVLGKRRCELFLAGTVVLGLSNLTWSFCA